MTELDPEIWNNPTLGAAAPNENLDRLTRQQIEDRAAQFEDREPRRIVVDNTYPGWTPEVNERTGTVASNYQTTHFEDENPNDIPVDSGRPDEDASTVEVPEEETRPKEENGPAEETDPGTQESDQSDSGVPADHEVTPKDDATAESGVGAPAHENGETAPSPAPEGDNTQWR